MHTPSFPIRGGGGVSVCKSEFGMEVCSIMPSPIWCLLTAGKTPETDTHMCTHIHANKKHKCKLKRDIDYSKYIFHIGIFAERGEQKKK